MCIRDTKRHSLQRASVDMKIFRKICLAGPSSGSGPVSPHPSYAEDPRTGCSSTGGVSLEWSRETEAHPLTCCPHCFHASQDMEGFVGTLLSHVQLFIPQPSPQGESFSSGLVLIHSLSNLYLCLQLPQSRCRTLHLALLNFRKINTANTA